MGIKPPAEKFKISRKENGITMQSYYGGRSETMSLFRSFTPVSAA
jgi:hypothetical protein